MCIQLQALRQLLHELILNPYGLHTLHICICIYNIWFSRAIEREIMNNYYVCGGSRYYYYAFNINHF